MPGTLFQFPKTIAWDNGSAQAGATLTFSQTGTSTAQDIYTDVDLTVAHSNPVTADSEGLFAPIYLDPSLPDYRVVFKDSGGTTIYTVDDVPASVGAVKSVTIEDTSPAIIIKETDATANEGNWRIIANGDQLLIQLANDALDTFTTIFTLDRTATTADTMTLAATTVAVSGNETVSGTLAVTGATTVGGDSVAVTTSGSFTGTFTGFATPPTGTIKYKIVGGICHLWATAGVSDTSNSTAMTMTGLPSACQPASIQRSLCPVLDNSAVARGAVDVDVDSTVTFYLSGSATGFTASGSKGIGSYWQISYPLD